MTVARIAGTISALFLCWAAIMSVITFVALKPF
jgi:hypothetical protein